METEGSLPCSYVFFMLSPSYPVSNLKIFSLQVLFNIILPSTSNCNSTRWSLQFRSCCQNQAFLICPIRATYPYICLPWLVILNIYWSVQIIKAPHCAVSPASCHFFIFGLILSLAPCSQTASICAKFVAPWSASCIIQACLPIGNRDNPFG
jgi:hypothetical protein